MRTPLLLLALVTAAPAALASQQRPAAFESWAAPIVLDNGRSSAAGVSGPERGRSTARLVAGGLLGGGLGLGAGALLGGLVGGGNKICGDDPCGLDEAIFGAIGGEVALLPLGVHLANGRRGKYLPSLAVSAAIAGVGIVLSGNGDHGEVMVAVPIAQLVSSLLIERGT
jgi:hypothetical protein